MDCPITEACSYAKISTVCYYENIKKDPELANEFKQLRDKPVLAARKSVVNGMKKDPALALKYLERKRNNEFNTRQVSDTRVLTGEMSEEQRKRVDQILKDNKRK